MVNWWRIMNRQGRRSGGSMGGGATNQGRPWPWHWLDWQPKSSQRGKITRLPTGNRPGYRSSGFSEAKARKAARRSGRGGALRKFALIVVAIVIIALVYIAVNA